MRHFLIWPDDYPRWSVSVDLDRHEREFIFIRPRETKTWGHLRSAVMGSVVLDPHDYLEGDLLRLVRSRGATIISGIEKCRAQLERKDGSR